MRTRRVPAAVVVMALATLGLSALACSGGDATTAETTTTAGDPSLGPELTRVTGTVETGEVVGALESPAALPLELSVPERGFGNGGVLNDVRVGGEPASIVWDGGRSVLLTGDGTVALQPGPFRVRDGALFADMSDAGHPLAPGDYAIEGPVAVGDPSGLAAPSTHTAFTAGDDASFSGTGRVEGRLPAGSWLLLGPGRIEVTGSLSVETHQDTTSAETVSMEDGSFEVTFTVGDDGVRVHALVEGPLTTG